jgi:hypothetical protein
LWPFTGFRQRVEDEIYERGRIELTSFSTRMNLCAKDLTNITESLCLLLSQCHKIPPPCLKSLGNPDFKTNRTTTLTDS